MSDATTFESFRHQLGRLLTLADEQLTPADRDSLRFAIKKARSERLDPEALDLSLGGRTSRIASLGGRLYSLMAAADQELRPERVAELEALIPARLDIGV
jgi:hypothetical protein